MKLFRVRPKFGDTLIEVTLAVGIFSMVAVAVVSVVSTSTSNAQISLETTVTREQIDAQAEALRFIHSAYVSAVENKEPSTNKYITLWKAITDKANNASVAGVLEYNPSSCAELYSGSEPPIKKQNAFILDARHMSSSNPNAIIIPYNNKKFTAASTYPRLVYNDASDALIDEDTGTTFSRAEGLFIVAVRDNKTTYTVEGGTVKKVAGYYDFYIHSCWYGPGASRPSTISTVVRLHDPARV
ncbi:hypothetical protein IKW73_01335 [Candidatus Saccharibacteria bacterium]|nr:hypothetical protein [Candidatus Saccharibacteria bacterium]